MVYSLAGVRLKVHFRCRGNGNQVRLTPPQLSEVMLQPRAYPDSTNVGPNMWYRGQDAGRPETYPKQSTF
jgi:hypothetical protein